MKWEEDKRIGLEPGGVYPAKVVAAEETVSQKGNPYISLELSVYREEESFRMFDVIMPQFAEKLEAFCQSAGLYAEYEARFLSPGSCEGREVYVEIDTEMRQGKNGKAYYQIKTYRKPKPKPTEDIPF